MSLSSPEHYRRAGALFDAALELPDDERDAYVEREAADDPELLRSVRALLHAHRHTAGFLESPAVELAAGLVRDAWPQMPDRIGAFTVIRELGRGGMGTVYLAERHDGQFEQRVALKIVRSGVADEKLVQRFLAERRILAGLQHPHIARLLDGGLTPDGLPYFAMEYVEGRPITSYCDDRALAIEGRLELFLKVCAAVQYAHQNLVVHRDLKPGNILVTADGDVRLLDFGIARLLDSDPDDSLTGTGVRPMTPEYASPEQFRGDGITTSSDVYSLGVLLYVMLSGRHPYREADTPRQVLEERVLGGAPAELGNADSAAASATTAAERARKRGFASPQRLKRRLRGDLDTIVRKAMRREPDRRYASAEELAADLRRHLHGLPVEARPESSWYRTRKFIGRHRAASVAAAIALLLLPALTLRELHLRTAAESATREARASASRAESVGNFLIGVFEVSDPYGVTGESGENVTARTLLDRGVERIDDLSSDPDVRAEMLGVLGRVYSNLGLYDESERLLTEARDHWVSRFPAPHAATAGALAALGNHHLTRSRHDDAEPLLRGALEQRRALFGDTHEDVAESLDRLATLMQERSLYDAADTLFREALEMRRRIHGDVHPDVATSLNNLGLLTWWKGEHGEAERLYTEALDVRRRVLPDGHLQTLVTMQNLANVYHITGRLAEAEVMYRESLEAKRRTLGDAHPSVTIHLNNLGRLLWEAGKMDESEALIREALALDRQIFGDEHAFVAASLDQLGASLRARGHLHGAEDAFRQALDLNRRMLGERHARTALSINSIAAVRYELGDVAGAETMFVDVVERFAEVFGEDHNFTASAVTSLARINVAQGRYAEAERSLRAVIERLGPRQPVASETFLLAHLVLARALMLQRSTDEALVIAEAADSLAGEQYAEGHRRRAEASLVLGRALAAQGRFGEAVPLIRASVAALEASPIRQPMLVREGREAIQRMRVAGGVR